MSDSPNTAEWYELKAKLAARSVKFYAANGDIEKMLMWVEIEEEARHIAMILRQLSE